MSELIFRDNADSYRSIGLVVLPAIPGEKRPIVPWKTYQSGVSEEIHQRWKEEFPPANIGLVTGKATGIITLDLDSEEALRRFEKEICPLQDILTPAVKTPHGNHIHFKYPDFPVRNGVNILGKKSGIDVRGDGGFAVLPPSRLSDGGLYQWLEGRDPRSGVPFAEAPEAFLRFLRDHSTKNSPNGEFPLDEKLQGVSEGMRNQRAAELAGHYFGVGFDYSNVLKLLLDWNARNIPPLHEIEIRKVVRSIQNRELIKRRWDKESKNHESEDPEKAQNFNIEKIEKVDSDPPIYFVHVLGAKIEFNFRQLSSFPSFRARVGEVTDRIVDFPNPKKWLRYLNHLLATRLTVMKPPDEINLDGRVLEEITRYADEHGSQNTKLIRGGAGAYIRDGMLHLPTKFFYDLASSLKAETSRIWEAVRRLGGESKVVRLPVSDDEETTRVLRVWILPMSRIAMSPDFVTEPPVNSNQNGELPL